MATYPQADDEDYKSYTTLSQIDCCIRWSYTKDTRHLEKLLKKTKNIDYQIPVKGKFVSHTNEKLIGKSALHLACDCYWHKRDIGKCESIQVLLNYNADTTIKDALGLTALLGLVEDGCESKNWMREGSFACGCVSRLLSAQVASNKHENPCNEHGLSHFHVACMVNHSAAVQFFLKHGVDVNQTVSIDSPKFSGYNPLHFAINSCALQTVQILLENGADMLQKDANGLTPIHQLLELSVVLFNKIDIHRGSNQPANEVLLADIDKHQEIMELFLKIERVRKLNVLDEFGLSVLHLACILKSESLIDHLLVNDTVDLDQAIDVNSPTCPGFTPLHFGAMFNFDIALMLLKLGASPLTKNTRNQSALDICLKKYSVNEIHGMLSTQSEWRDTVMSDGETKLLDLVYSMQDHTCFERFLETFEQRELSVPLDSPLWPGYSLLHLAVLFSERSDVEFHKQQGSNSEKADWKIIEKCLQWNPKALVAQDTRGSTPLHLAFLSKKLQTVEKLLFQCGQENPANINNLSHFHIACAIGYSAPVESLIINANLNIPVSSNYEWFEYVTSGSEKRLKTFQIRNGDTPLHIAVSTDNYHLAPMLLERGADLNSLDANGMTPIHRLMCHDIGHYYRKDHESKTMWSHLDLKHIVVKDVGLSHLHVAVYFEVLDAVKRLLESGADANAMISQQLAANHELARYAGFTPLYFLMNTFDKDEKILELLLQHGADVLAVVPGQSSILKYMLVEMKSARVFASYLKRNEAEQSRVRESTGLTMLHLACYTLDLESVESILRNDKLDVNAQVHRDSQFWPGCTPLHVLMLWNEIRGNSDEDDVAFVKRSTIVCNLLLQSGANVALWSNYCGTPMHAGMLTDYTSTHISSALIICVNAMLDKYTNFNENPVGRYGISLFHVACRMNAVRAAKKFLEHGVDVNEPIDRFLCCPNACEYSDYTPLHLCLTHPYSLRMVDLLLKHGANVHVENFDGKTPLHKAAFCHRKRRKIFEKLIAAGADVNAENVHGETPLELILFITRATAQDFKFFIKHGYRNNYFNDISQLSLMSYIFEEGLNEEKRWSLARAMFNAPGFCEPDQMGRTALHSIVACKESCLTQYQYVNLIEIFTNAGCTIDHRNNWGQTALHYAAFFSNPHAVSALLLAGADINFVDDKNDTPYSCALNPYVIVFDDGLDNCLGNCKSVIKILANHVLQLQVLDLHVNRKNAIIQRDLIPQGLNLNVVNARLAEYLKVDLNHMLEPYSGCAEELKVTPIGNSSIIFGDFLSDEGGVVFAYPTMDLKDRDDIDNFFENNRLSQLEETFGEHTKFLNLQYGKSLARKTLLHQAKMSLMALTRFSLTEFCAHMTVRCLRNDDLKNVHAAAHKILI